MLKALAIIAGVIFALVTGYGGAVAWAAASQGYSWREMDWNGDGATSPSEFLTAADIGRRPFYRHGKLCTEFYSLKDGMPVRVNCG